MAEHPADEARLRAITATLELIGASDVATRLADLWQRFLSAAGEQPPPDYDVCYPQQLIEGLARRVVDGCRALGLRPFDDGADPTNNIPALLAEAWRRFSLDSDRYADWERPELAALWLGLGFSSSSP